MGLFGRRSGLTPADAHDALAGRRLLLVDVREPGEYAAGHAPGARNVPLAQVAGTLGALQAEADASGVALAVVCRSGLRSAAAAAHARRAGVTVQNVRGGMIAWQRAGLPVTRA